MKYKILINVMCCMVGCILARTISPPSMKLEDNENGRIIDVKASSLVVNDEETKTLLAWLNMINNKASSSPQGKIPNSRGRSIPSSINDNAGDAESYVKKDGFLVAKSPSNVPSLLKKCEGFAFVLKNLRNVRLVCQPGYCLLVGGKEPNQIKIYAIIETSTLQCVDKSDEYFITVKNANSGF